LLVLRNTLRHDLRDLASPGDPRWLLDAQPELADAEDGLRRPALLHALAKHLPEVDAPAFERCIASLRPGEPWWRRMAARRDLERRLAPHAGRSVVTIPHRILSRVQSVLPRGAAGENGNLLSGGGLIIALVGADGSGKSTCAAALTTSLGSTLRTRHAHLGRPPRSVLTLLAGGAYKVARAVTHPAIAAHFELLRCLCTARDRYRLYRRLGRLAAQGTIVIAERYPIPENRALVGPSSAQGVAVEATTRFADVLRTLERDYYARIAAPDLVFALRVDPETAVRRKTSEPADYVRARAGLMWSVNWSRSRACVIDANRELPDVLTELRGRVWESL
jgi:thymidylate kinase